MCGAVRRHPPPRWRLHSFIDVSVEVRAGCPAGLPGPGFLPLYSFWQQTVEQPSQPFEDSKAAMGVGGWLGGDC